MEYALIAVAGLILIVSVANGYCRGFIRTALGMVAMILCLVLVYLFGAAVSKIIREQTPVYGMTSDAIQQTLRESLELPDILTREGQKEILEQSFLPDILVEKIMKQADQGGDVLGADAFFQQAGDSVAGIVVDILGCAVTFLIAFVLIRLAFVVGGLVGSVPGLHFINQLFGALLGAVRGLFVLWLLCFVIMLFAPTSYGQEALQAINQNAFLSTFYSGALSFGNILRLGVVLI